MKTAVEALDIELISLEESMTIWHVQKLYTSDGKFYRVFPYEFITTLKDTLKMKKGIRQMMKFLSDSRLTEKGAYSLCKKKNDQLLLKGKY